MNQITVYVSGASGYVGKALVTELKNKAIEVVEINRSMLAAGAIKKEPREAKGHCVFVNLAGRAHESKTSDYELYVQDNVKSLEQALELSAKIGIKRFVHVSTIKVYGEKNNCTLSLDDPCEPESNYGITKMISESIAYKNCMQLGISLDILRIPLIVSPDAKGNVGAIVKLLKKQIPIPMGQFKAPRTMLQRKELIHKIISLCCEGKNQNSDADSPFARLHLLGDPKPLSSSDLVLSLAEQLKVPAKIFSLPLFLFWTAAYFGDLLLMFQINFPLTTSKMLKLNGKLILVLDSRNIHSQKELHHNGEF